ncbi:hypothetical protein HLV39_14115 [Marinobacter adhaerens]|uniref:Toxin VasX N-terminal region domain-containing protein n=1 Tax=Marinobacter adhaerens TaxID=1033846 RepID=A0A851I3G9_9GAMM|nr:MULTISPECIES: toxin VasX [Marinobacter]NWN92628.1 hypothetical protein [Marinobacter adhaerens]
MGAIIGDPVAAGDRQSQADITAEGACPLTRTDIQLIPVRYAYVDKPVDHDALESQYELGFQPVGIRQVRDGYLYLFHSDAPDTLHEYQITEGGAVTKRLWTGSDATKDQRAGTPDTPAVVVPRRGHIDVLFSSAQLTAKKCSMLIRWESYRSEVMRRVVLSGYCPIKGSPQLLNKPDLEQLLQHPVKAAVPIDGQTDLPPWYWSQDTMDGSREPFSHRLAAYEQDHAYLVVDDLTGHISDLLDAWGIVDTNHTAWLEKEDATYYPARFISDLIRLDGERIGEVANAFADQVEDADGKVIFKKIAQASRDQKTELKQLVDSFPEYQNSTKKIAGPMTVSFMPEDGERVRAMREGAQALAGELGLAQSEMLNVVESLAEYQENLVDGSALSGQQGIADLVRLNEMNSYLEESQKALSWFADEKQRIVSDIQCLLESFYLHGHLYDRASEKHYGALLGLDNALITILAEWSQAKGDFSFLKQFYFEEIGHQHLISLDLKPEIIPGAVKDLIDAFKSLMAARSGPTAYREWLELVENSSHFQFPELPPGAAEQLSHHLAQLNVTARIALFELVEAADAANLQGRLKQVFQRMPPGLQAHIFENQRLYQIDLDIADGNTLAKHESLVQEIEHLAQQHEEALADEKRLEQRRSEASTRARKSNKHQYDQQIGEARTRKQLLATQLRERGFQLMDTSPVEGELHNGALLIGGITRTTYGRAVQSELDELKRLQARGGLTSMWDYGRGIVHGQSTADVSVRIGGLGLVSFMGIVGAVGAWDALKKIRDDAPDASYADAVSGVAGTIGTAASVMTIIGSARLNYYYQTVSQTEAVLSRLARVNVWGGTIAAWGGFFAAGADWFKQLSILRSDGQSDGTKASALITLTGDSLLLVGSGRMAFTGSGGIYHILRKPASGITWKSVNRSMLSLAGGVFRGLNAYLWIGTAVVFIGNWIQSYYARTDIQRWCEHSAWGNEPRNWSSDEQRHELAKVMYQPALLVKAEKQALDGRTGYCAFRLELPGISALQADNMEWSVLRNEGTTWEPDSDHWNKAVLKQSLGDAGLALEIILTSRELDTINGCYLAFRYKPSSAASWLPESEKAYHYELMLHEQGNLPMTAANETKAWQLVAPLTEANTKLAPMLSAFGFHSLVEAPKGS